MIQAVKLLMEKYVRAIHQWIDLTTAILLLTGQLTIRSVIFASNAYFSLSLGGPIIGDPRAEPIDEPSSVVLDTLDVLLALMLIIGEVNVSGMFIQSQRFTLLVTGPPFGAPKSVAYVPSTDAFYDSLRTQILERYQPQLKSQVKPPLTRKSKPRSTQRTKRK